MVWGQAEEFPSENTGHSARKLLPHKNGDPAWPELLVVRSESDVVLTSWRRSTDRGQGTHGSPFGWLAYCVNSGNFVPPSSSILGEPVELGGCRARSPSPPVPAVLGPGALGRACPILGLRLPMVSPGATDHRLATVLVEGVRAPKWSGPSTRGDGTSQGLSCDSCPGSKPSRGNGREQQGERAGWAVGGQGLGRAGAWGGGGEASGLERSPLPGASRVPNHSPAFLLRSWSAGALGRPQWLHPQDRGAGGEGGKPARGGGQEHVQMSTSSGISPPRR